MNRPDWEPSNAQLEAAAREREWWFAMVMAPVFVVGWLITWWRIVHRRK